jgi:two-component system phosphate regulon sensor histidine kinase PhoR
MGSPRTRLQRSHIVALIFVLAVLPSAGLAWAAWQLLDQDRELERRQRQDRLDRAANDIVLALRSTISEIKRASVAGDGPPPGAIAVTLRSGGITVTPPERIAFQPVPAVLPDAADDSLRQGAALFARGRDLAAAGRKDEALNAFGDILNLRPFSIGGTPSWIAARYSRSRIFERLGRDTELHEEAGKLASEMRRLASHLTAATYQIYAEDASRWLRSPLPHEPVLLSGALDILWQRWSTRAMDTAGSDVLGNEAESPVAIWDTSGDTLQAVVATRGFVDSVWMRRARDVAQVQQVSIALGPNDARGPSSRTVEMKELPWPVTVSDVSRTGDAASQRRLIVIVSFLGLVVVVAVAATRAISRELAVARQQSNFVAAVSHEFRTPLTSLRHFVELLREQPSLDADRRRDCYDAQARAVDRLSRLVESLLDFGKLDAGTQQYRLASQDCAALAQSVVNDFADHAINAGYRIVLDAPQPATVNVDVDAFSRALWNLLDNAMKYSQAPSTIDVAVRAAADTVSIAVRDQGIGVAPDETRDIFRRFHRGAEARSRGIRGTGLGLAMVTEIMRAHGGRVDLDSHPGQGSTFTLVFPAAA